MTDRVLVGIVLVIAVGSCGGKAKSADSRVRAEVRRLEPRSAKVEIEVERADIGEIPGVELYGATVMLPGHPGYRCAVHGDQVWCRGEDRLSRVIAASGIGSNPDAMSDAVWIDLAAFLLDATPLRGQGTANLLDGYAPAEVKATIVPPEVTRTDQQLTITFFVERVSYSSYPSGPMRLAHITVLVSRTGAARLQTDVVWDSTESGGQ